MSRVDEQLTAHAAAEGLRQPDASTGHLLLQIHDELLYEVEEGHADRLRRIVKEAMVGAWETQLRVPLRVVVREGKSWGSLKNVEALETPCSG